MARGRKDEELFTTALLDVLADRWPDCALVAAYAGSDGAIDLLVACDDGNLVIAGKKSGARAKLGWQLASAPPEAVKAILEALKLKRSISFVSYSVPKTGKCAGKLSLAKSVSKLTWQQIFPDDELPEAFQWTVDKQQAKKQGDSLVVIHTLKNGRARQVHEYRLALKNVSMAIFESTLLYKTFPFNIPHSHKVTEDKKVTYDRSIEEWAEHSNQKGLLEDSNVQKKNCSACRVEFYDMSTQDFCYGCMIGRQGDAKKEALKLCKLAEKTARGSDWKETADKLKDLQQQWQRLQNIPRAENEKLWTRFQKANQGFFDRRSQFFDDMDKQRASNLAKAKKLIKAAEKAVTKQNRHEAREEVKVLQQQWKAVNPLPREHSDALWTEFRGVCQTVFDRR